MAIVLVVAVVVGVGVRFHGLGERQLSTVEFYLVTSVDSILESGLPRIPGGGYYHPGLAHQYAVAASVALFGDGGFAYRLPGVLFSLGLVALTYAYARPRMGNLLASSVCAVLLLSSWEVEFARLARPYALLQFVAMLLFLSITWSWWSGRRKLRYVPHVLVGVAAVASEFPPVLAILLFLPYLAPETVFSDPRDKFRYGIVTAVVVIAVLLFSGADFRTLGVSHPLPPGVAPESRSLIQLPVFPFWSLNGSPGLTLALMCATVAAICTLFAFLRQRQSPPPVENLVAVLLVVAVVFHNFLVAAGIATLLTLRYRVWLRPREHHFAVLALGLASLVGLAWLVRALVWSDWTARATVDLGYESLAAALRVTFFGWPDFFRSFILPWGNTLPALGLVFVVACAIELLCLVRAPRRAIAESPAVMLFLVTIAMGVMSFEDRSLGSSFLLLPLAWVVLATVLVRITRFVTSRVHSRRPSAYQIVAAVALFGLFAVSRDFNAKHLLNIRSQAVALRTGEFQPCVDIWSDRQDVVSPVRFVASVLDESPEALVIVQGVPAASRHLSGAYLVHYSRHDMRFRRVSRREGTLDAWSKHRLISTDEEVRTVCESSSRIWVIRRTGEDRGFCRGTWPSVQESTAFQGADRRIEVVLMERAETRVSING